MLATLCSDFSFVSGSVCMVRRGIIAKHCSCWGSRRFGHIQSWTTLPELMRLQFITIMDRSSIYLVQIDYCRSGIARPRCESRHSCFDMSRRAPTPACYAKDPATRHPKTILTTTEFSTSIIRDDAGKAKCCTPDIAHCRPKITGPTD